MSHEPATSAPVEVHGTASATSTSGRFSLPVSWADLTYKVPGHEVLRGLTGTALPSRSLAIIGSSGAGKTTMLNAISARVQEDATHVVGGRRQLGDIEFERKYRKVVGYVTQDDIIGALATPASALAFSLRIRRGTSREETEQRVNDVLRELHLEHCRDTVVGIPGLVAGLSGGERKRTNIGVELITDPKVLLLDEPTSGLDSVTSAKVVHLLQELAHRGRTVIFTIHQPTAEVLTYFDDLLLLTQGRAAYHGPMAGAVEYFASIGYPCPESFTPTDYFMTLLQDDEVAPKLTAAWDAHAAAHPTPYTTAVPAADKRELGQSATYAYLNKYVEKTGSGLGIQFVELSRRAVSEVMRNKMYIFMTFVQAIFFALIVGLIFLNLGKDVQSVQDRQGLLFMITANRAFGSAMMLINTFPRDRAIFVREQRAGAYSPFLYFATKSVAELPVQVLGAFVESVMIYFMTDLHRSAGAFFYYFAVIVMLSQVAGGLGFAISATVESYVVAAGLAPLCVVPSLMTGGLLANTDRLRPYWYWLEKVSFVRQAFVLLARNEFSRLDTISCDAVKYGATFCGAQAQNGNQVIENLGFNDQDQEWAMWVSLAILFVLFRICVVLSLTRVARSTN